MKIVINPAKLAKILGIVALILVFLSLVVDTAEIVSGKEILNKFDVDWEGSFPSLFNTVLLVTAAALLYFIAAHKKTIRDSFAKHWMGLSVIFLLLSIDETVSIHESFQGPIREMLGVGGIFFYAWVIPAAFLLFLFTIAYWKFIRHLPQQTYTHFLISGLIYISGAFGMELVGGWYTDSFGIETLAYMFITTIEESLELAGLILFIYALLEYMRTLSQEIRVNFTPEL